MSAIEICNSALIKIGSEPILSLDDRTKEGRLCKVRFPSARRIVLSAHPWRFARARAVLTAQDEEPEFGYKYKYPLPADLLKVYTVRDRSGEATQAWRHEGRYILTNLPKVFLTYIRDNENYLYMPEYVKEAIACYLAYDLSYAISQNGNLRDHWANEYKIALRFAKSGDSKDDSLGQLNANEWADSRIHGRYHPDFLAGTSIPEEPRNQGA